MNHFELFGLPFQFVLDGGLLSNQFRELQRRFHPDSFATASERDRMMAMQKAAQINDAYQTLKHPISRAEYMLAQVGHDIAGEQQTLKDMNFLMEQMELREQLELIAESSDPAGQLMMFEQNVTTSYQAHLNDLIALLDSEQWEQAADSVRKLKFIDKLRNEIERLEETLLN